MPGGPTAIGKFIASGAGQAVLGGLASGIGSIFGGGSRRKAYHRSKRLMKYQMGLDKDMFDYQNAYNTPAAQMARLKSAGLNPALMYGQGTTGNASGYPQSKFTQLDPYVSQGDIAQSTAAGVQISMLHRNKQALAAQEGLNKANAVIQGALGEGITANKKAYFEGLVSEWKMAQTKQSLLDLEKGMKDNGVGNWTIASALTFITGEPGHKIDLNKKVLKGSRIAEFLGMDNLTYGQAIIAGIGLVKAGTWTIDKFATLFMMFRKPKYNKGKTVSRTHTRKSGNTTITNKSTWVNDNY